MQRPVHHLEPCPREASVEASLGATLPCYTLISPLRRSRPTAKRWTALHGQGATSQRAVAKRRSAVGSGGPSAPVARVGGRRNETPSRRQARPGTRTRRSPPHRQAREGDPLARCPAGAEGCGGVAKLALGHAKKIRRSVSRRSSLPRAARQDSDQAQASGEAQGSCRRSQGPTGKAEGTGVVAARWLIQGSLTRLRPGPCSGRAHRVRLEGHVARSGVTAA